MASYYRSTIALGLKQYDNGKRSDQFYKDLAWEGLRYKEIPTWKNLSKDEKDRVNNTISAYILNHKNQTCTK